MPKYWVSVNLVNAILADYINVVKDEEVENLLKKADEKIEEFGLSDYVVDGDHYFRATDFQNAKEIKKKVEQLVFDLREKKEPMGEAVGAWVVINSHPNIKK